MSPSRLSHLPKDVILVLLHYLDATSLFLLGRSYSWLDEIIKNHSSLWKHIDARRAPNDSDKISYCLDRCYRDTHTLLLRADDRLETLILDDFFTRVNRFEHVVILALEQQAIDGYRFTIFAFPPQLHELSLKKSVVTNATEFFKTSGPHFPQLRVLILDECDWVTSSAFMPISKYVRLEILSVYKCRSIENSIAYLSLSGHGFRNLKIFDARLSPLGNTLIRSLYKLPSLLAIYLQNEDMSYKLDYFKRKFAILKGAPTRDFFVKDCEFDLNDSLTNESNGLNFEDPTTLDDQGLLDYLSTTTTKDEDGLPESVLYLDPYNKCTCGYEERQKDYGDAPFYPDSPSDDDDNDDNPGDNPGDGQSKILQQISKNISRLAQMIRRSQINNTFSRGLFDTNHPHSPLSPSAVITVHNANGDRYRSVHDHEDNVCVMNLEGVEQSEEVRRTRRRSMPQAEGVSPERIVQMIADVYSPPGAPESSDDDDYTATVEKRIRLKKPTSYHHRDRRKEQAGPSRVGDSDCRVRPLIDVHINPLDPSRVVHSSGEVPLREAPTEIRKRIDETKDEPPAKKQRTGDASPGPSGAPLPTIAEEGSDEYDTDVMPDDDTPHEKSELYRRVYFRDAPVVQIENIEEIRKETPIPLRRLSLRGYRKITNASLEYIKHLELELLDLTYTNVTQKTIEDYLVFHPFCRVVHEAFCVCPTNLHF